MDEIHALFKTGDDVQITTPSGECVPAKIIDYDIGNETYRARVPQNRFCQYSGMTLVVHKSTMLRYNPFHSPQSLKQGMAQHG